MTDCLSTLTQGAVATIKLSSSPEREYRIHVDLISPVSAYFERALIIQGASSLCLPDEVEPGTFELFVDWLYTGGELSLGTNVNVTEMFRAIVFGHTYMAPLFHAAVHNATVTFLVARKLVPSAEDIEFMFDNLPKDHAMRELLVELVYLRAAEGEAGLPRELVEQVEAKIQKRGIVLEWPELEACEWHVHESEKERSECVRKARDGY
jgi:hypothetical protein